MAKLYGRVFGLPRRKGIAPSRALQSALVVLLCLLAGGVRADAIDVHTIEGWAEDLRSGDEARVREAVQRLSHLPENALPAIEARLGRTRRQVVPEEDGYDALRYFRHAVGSRRADDAVDIAPGVPAVLMERPSPAVGRTAERLLILRSLEAIGNASAQRVMGDVLALTPEMWRWERRRLLARMGRRLLPGLIWLRGHREPGVRRWARAAVERLGLSDPGRAVQDASEIELAELFEAYAATRIMDAMPVIISYVGHDDERVRLAARAAMERYGQNGIWQLREAMRNQLGEEANLEWSWRTTATTLFEGLDARRLGPISAKLEEGLRAIESEQWSEGRALLDEVLLHAPDHPRRGELAPAYLALAERAQGEESRALLQRALWLTPEGGDASAIEARIEQHEHAVLAELGVELEAGLAEDVERAAPSAEPADSAPFDWRWMLWAALALGLLATARRASSLARRAAASFRAFRAREEVEANTSASSQASAVAESTAAEDAGEDRTAPVQNDERAPRWAPVVKAARAALARTGDGLRALAQNERIAHARRAFGRLAAGQGARWLRFLRRLHMGDESIPAVEEPRRPRPKPRTQPLNRATRAPAPPKDEVAIPANEDPGALGAMLLTPRDDDDATLVGDEHDDTLNDAADTPLDVPAPWMASTTSPGAIEAPDTLPG